jgi:hypothetical protein
MIQIIIKRSSIINRLFDRMPLPKSNKTRNTLTNRMGLRRLGKGNSLNKYQTHPFIRKISKIA